MTARRYYPLYDFAAIFFRIARSWSDVVVSNRFSRHSPCSRQADSFFSAAPIAMLGDARR